MAKSRIRQADIERLIRAAAKTGALIQVDLALQVATIVPGAADAFAREHLRSIASRKNDWDEVVDLSRVDHHPTSRPRIARTERQQRKIDEQLALHSRLGQKGMSEHWEKQADAWAASLPNEPLNKRERLALEQFAAHGVDVPVDSSEVKYLGPDTEERLKLRGYIDNDFLKKFPDRVDRYWITASGMAAWERLKLCGSST